MKITRDMTIGDIVSQYPEVIETLESFGVHCIGCHASTYEPLEMGLAGHGMSQEKITEIVTRLNEVVEKHRNQTEQKIMLTENAVNKLKTMLPANEKNALRVHIKKGGCSGFSYVFSLENDKKENDITLEQDGVSVYVDQESMTMIAGSEIDYRDSLQDAGFKVQNPQATANCGCGKSFR